MHTDDGTLLKYSTAHQGEGSVNSAACVHSGSMCEGIKRLRVSRAFFDRPINDTVYAEVAEGIVLVGAYLGQLVKLLH